MICENGMYAEATVARAPAVAAGGGGGAAAAAAAVPHAPAFAAVDVIENSGVCDNLKPM